MNDDNRTTWAIILGSACSALALFSFAAAFQMPLSKPFGVPEWVLFLALVAGGAGIAALRIGRANSGVRIGCGLLAVVFYTLLPIGQVACVPGSCGARLKPGAGVVIGLVLAAIITWEDFH